jgi:hypothetical protein
MTATGGSVSSRHLLTAEDVGPNVRLDSHDIGHGKLPRFERYSSFQTTRYGLYGRVASIGPEPDRLNKLTKNTKPRSFHA